MISERNTTTIDGYFMGDAYQLTGETELRYGEEWNFAILLEGHRKGETIPLPTPESKERRVKKNQQEYADMQAGFRLLHSHKLDAQNPKGKTQ